MEPSPSCTAYANAKAALVKFHVELEVEIHERAVFTFVLHRSEVHTGMAEVPGAVAMQTVARDRRMAAYLAGVAACTDAAAGAGG